MKTSLKTLALTACFTLVLCSSCYFPGSDQAKIKSEHCDSVYDISENQDKEWNSKQYPSAEEISLIIYV